MMGFSPLYMPNLNYIDVLALCLSTPGSLCFVYLARLEKAFPVIFRIMGVQDPGMGCYVGRVSLYFFLLLFY